MTVRFLAIAAQEYQDAFDHYESVVENLGEDFKEAVVEALGRIQDFPNAWQKVSPRTRRCRLARFPYGVVYQRRKQEILVVAIMHLRREPEYWVSRR